MKSNEYKNKINMELVLDLISEAVYGVDEKGLCAFVNKSFLSITGYDDPSYFIGKNIHEIIHHHDINGVFLQASECNIEHQVLKGRKGIVGESIVWKKDGTYIDVEFSSNPKFRDGLLVGAIVSFKDISERKRHIEKLESERNIAKKYFDIAGVLMVVLDKEGYVKLINEKGTEVLGLDKEDIIGKNWFEHFVFDEARHSLIDYFNSLLSMDKKKTSKMQNYILTSKKEKRLISWSNAALVDENDEIIGVIASGEDITEVNQMTELLKDSEERFRNLFENAPYGYQSLDKDGCFIEVNKKWLDLFGYDKNEVLGAWFGDFLTPEATKRFRTRFEVFKKNGNIHSEFPMRTKKGSYIMVGFDGEIGYSSKREFKQTHCLVKDITEIHLAQKKLVESEKNYRELVNNMPLGMIIQEGIYDENNQLIDLKHILANPEFCKQMNLPSEEVLNQTFMNLFPDTGEEMLSDYNKLSTNDRVTIEKYKEITDKYFKIIIYKMQEKNRFVVIFEDITVKKNRELEIEYLSNHDFLTDIHNRRAFVTKYNELNIPENYPLGVMMLDVNGLKIINDAFGHDTGDIVLKAVSSTLTSVFRKQDVVARLGGDEFGVIMPRILYDEIEEIKDNLKRKLDKSKVKEMDISVATGYVLKDESITGNLDEILKDAENHMYRHKVSEGISVRNKAIKAIFKTLSNKNIIEKVHSEKVSQLCKQIGIQMKLSKDEVRELELSGLFHDIGKISIPDAILNKPGRLTEEEYEIIKTHPELSYQILRAADEYSDLAIHALYHHERWDGFGYPKGIKEKDIPLFSRIINVADSYEAMTSERPYKRKMSKIDAIGELERCSGTQFDPEIVRVFVDEVL